jgi:hypothetical protein
VAGWRQLVGSGWLGDVAGQLKWKWTQLGRIVTRFRVAAQARCGLLIGLLRSRAASAARLGKEAASLT